MPAGMVILRVPTTLPTPLPAIVFQMKHTLSSSSTCVTFDLFMQGGLRSGMNVRSFYNSKRASRDREQVASDGPLPGDATDTEHAQKEPRLQGSKPKKCLLAPQPVWRTFPRQQMAFDFANTCKQNVAVFAYELEEFGREGQRGYLVSTYYEFGQRYWEMKRGVRHYYELIGQNSACHLYFDIELKKEVNHDVDCIALLDTFIEYVCYQLYYHYRVHCDRTNILDLDSSTPHKFSHHLIYHIPSTAFRNNITAGHFVHSICDQLRSLKFCVDSGMTVEQAFEQVYGGSSHTRLRGAHTPPQCPSGDRLLSLFVLNENGDKILMCDEAVYTKNRNFRIYQSSKLGKDVCLTVAKENKFRSGYREDDVKRRRSQWFNTLMDSLVCNVSYNTHQRILDFDSPNQPQRRRPRQPSKTSSSLDSCSESQEGFSYSPFPLVDQFITSQLTRGGVQGSIRRWTYFPQGKQVVYDIQHNRWCENINRAHKSNNIMIVADLSRGVYYQKCHDPECKRVNFRSNEYNIPDKFNPLSTGDGDTMSADVQIYVGDISEQELEELNDHLPELEELNKGDQAPSITTASDEDVKLYIGDISDKEILELEEDGDAGRTVSCTDDKELVPSVEDTSLSLTEMESFCEDF